ncbi:MAG: tetratricopeptide repeat protein [Candidatus Pelagibacterales bacterium]|jgi:cytochrome c-type biogenesis protein CcmH/NrfG|tara:strand:+ start:1103 stop:1501 length:399 start_codon:yes stop_codon:yes gene_type:complete
MKYFIILTLFLYSSHSWSASNFYDNALENFNETKYETAIKYLEKEIVFNPKSSESFVLLGKSYEKIDDLSTANKYYNIAFTLVPHNLELNFLLGKTAYNLGNIEDYAEFISNLEILCDKDCEEIDNLKLLAE